MMLAGVTAAVAFVPVLGPLAVAAVSAAQTSTQVTNLFNQTTVATASANPHENVLKMTKPETWEWVLAGVMAILSVAQAAFALKGLRPAASGVRPVRPTSPRAAATRAATFGPKSVGAAQRGLASAVKFTRQMHSQSEVIARGTRIAKVNELVSKFGGKAKGWVKKKTWEVGGMEIHYYEHAGIGRRGVKWAGEPDPF